MEAFYGSKPEHPVETDAVARFKLGCAYVDLEAYEAAVVEMGFVLLHDGPGSRCERALDVILDPHLLSERREVALDTLRQLLFAN